MSHRSVGACAPPDRRRVAPHLLERKRRWPSFIIWRWAGPALDGWIHCRWKAPLLVLPPRRPRRLATLVSLPRPLHREPPVSPQRAARRRPSGRPSGPRNRAAGPPSGAGNRPRRAVVGQRERVLEGRPGAASLPAVRVRVAPPPGNGPRKAVGKPATSPGHPVGPGLRHN
jgi:hypothetical protein